MAQLFIKLAQTKYMKLFRKGLLSSETIENIMSTLGLKDRGIFGRGTTKETFNRAFDEGRILSGSEGVVTVPLGSTNIIKYWDKDNANKLVRGGKGVKEKINFLNNNKEIAKNFNPMTPLKDDYTITKSPFLNNGWTSIINDNKVVNTISNKLKKITKDVAQKGKILTDVEIQGKNTSFDNAFLENGKYNPTTKDLKIFDFGIVPKSNKNLWENRINKTLEKWDNVSDEEKILEIMKQQYPKLNF